MTASFTACPVLLPRVVHAFTSELADLLLRTPYARRERALNACVPPVDRGVDDVVGPPAEVVIGAFDQV
jgi:hypothetical protein